MSLSRSTGELIEALSATQAEPYDCDALIVGSGYGAAVAAARLAGLATQGRPWRIWLVERGREYQPGDFPSRFAELPGHLRATLRDGDRPGRVVGAPDGLLDLRVGGDAAALLGNGLGGGSLINANVMAQPEAAVFQQGWPAALDRVGLAAAYQRARTELGVQQAPDQPPLPKFALLRSLTPDDPAGLAPLSVAFRPGSTPAGVAMQACTLCGDCMTGCNVGAKGSLDTSYLARAHAGGVQMFCGVSAEWLARDGEGWVLHWQPTLAPLRLQFGPQRIRCRRLILAAGSLGSTEILLRSREQGLALSPRLGEGFSTNGDNIAAGHGHAHPTRTVADPESDPAGRAAPDDFVEARRVGPTIVGLKRVPEQALGARPGFVLEEFAIPSALRRVYGEVVALLAALRGQTWRGADAAGVSEADIEHLSCFGLMGDDGAAGRLVLAPDRVPGLPEGQIEVSWPDLADHPLFVSMSEWLEAAFKGEAPRPLPQPLALIGESGPWAKAVAGALMRKAFKSLGLFDSHQHPLLDDLIAWLAPELDNSQVLTLLGPSLGLPVTVHPLGGCRMSDHVADGVVDVRGRVWDPSSDGAVHPGLLVLDGAIVPRALGINPALTITALAELAVQQLTSSDPLWQGERSAAAPLPLPPRRVRPRRAGLPAAARWSLQETLQGPLRWQGKRWWARLELAYEDIPGFSRALALPERVLQLRRGLLRLYDWPAAPLGLPDFDEHGFPARGRQLVCAEVGGQLRLLMPLGGAQGPASRDERFTLDYRLQVLGVDQPCDGSQPLRVGSPLFLRKLVGLAPGQRFDREPSWLRQLTEAEVTLDGERVGRWRLDMDELASVRVPLLRLMGHSSLPDAMLDALVGGSHMLRLLRGTLAQAVVAGSRSAWAPNLERDAQVRWPGAVRGLAPECTHQPDGSGARLSRYCFGQSPRPAVLLIHGLGASGNSYTLDALAADAPRLIDLLADEGRDVWVLDVRSSIANERGRAEPASDDWRVQAIAHLDVVWALRQVAAQTGQKVDVFAHCMGAVMLWMAVLQGPLVGQLIHSAVFSQVGPLLLPSPFNRLRGLLAGALARYLNARELDTCPDFECVNGQWRLKPGVVADEVMRLVRDGLLATYPYPDDDGESLRAEAMGEQGWRSVRHLGDAIFGQLFELGQLHDRTLLQLDALLGWVKLPMLEQAVQFARLKRLTGDEGLDLGLSEAHLRACLSFPVLMLHGRRNRVFDWRGSVDSFELLARALGQLGQDPAQPQWGRTLTRYGDVGAPVQLLIAEQHGHFDCVIGREVGRTLMPEVLAFWASAQTGPQAQPLPLPPPPASSLWLGPQQGWLRVLDAPGDWLALRVLLQPKSREPAPPYLALVPVRLNGGARKVLLDRAELFVPPPRVGDEPHPLRLDLQFERRRLAAVADHWALLALEQPLDDEPQALPAPVWYPDGRPALVCTPRARLQLEALLLDKPSDSLFEDCLLRLPARVLDAADQGRPGPRWLAGCASPDTSLRLALASCQYPPDLFNRDCANAGFASLLDRVRRADGPQALLLMGDQVYLDATAGVFDPRQHRPVGGEQRERQLMRQTYEEAARLPARRRTLAALPCYPMLDDHEFGDNWPGLRVPDDGLQPAYRRAAQQLYAHWQEGLAPSRPAGQASYGYRIWPGGLPVFVLDTRSQRRPAGSGAGPDEILPRAELAQLIADLRALPAHCPKLVVSPVPLLPPRRLGSRLGEDDWMGFPDSCRQLLGALRELSRVVLLSGDAHVSSISRLRFDNGQVLHAVVASGLYAPWPFANQRPDEWLADGPLPASVLGLPGCELRVDAQSTQARHAQLTLTRDGTALSLQVVLYGALVDLPGDASTPPLRIERRYTL